MHARGRSLFLPLTGLIVSALFGLSVAAAAVEDKEATPNSSTGSATPRAEMQFEVKVPTIEMEESNVSEAILRSVFEGKLAEHAEKLSKLTARRIRIPEIRVRTLVPGSPASEAVYRDLVLDNVVNGVVESASLASADLEGTEGITFHFARMSSGTVDFAGVLQYYGFAPSAGSTEMKPLYKDFIAEGGAISGPDFSCSFRQIALAEIKARPLKIGFREVMQVVKDIEASSNNTAPGLVTRLVAAYGDVLSSFESTPMSSAGFDCAGKSEKGPVAVGAKSLTVGAFRPGRYPEISADGISVKVGDDRSVSVGNALFKGFDYSGALKTLEAAVGPLDEAWFAQHYRELIPSFEGWAVSDVKVDLPDEDNGARIALALAAHDVTLGHYVNGIPTDISSKTSHLAFAIPSDTGVDYLEQLKSFGINDVDVSYELSARWNETSRDIVVEKLSVNGVDMGSVSLSALIGNAVTDLFSSDDTTAEKAAYDLTVKQFGLDLADTGLGAKVIDSMAGGESTDPAKYRSRISGQIRGAILSLLGSTPEVEALSDAVGVFLGAGGSLSVLLKAKDAAGLDFDTLQALMANPGAITDLIEIIAKATPPQ